MISSFIETAHCFSSLQEKIASLCPQSLVVFDIDDVLITAKDVALRQPHKKTWLNRYIDSYLSSSAAFEASANMWSVYETQISDPVVADIILKLGEKNVPSVALTAGWNGKLGQCLHHCNDRIHSLRTKGIDFSQSFSYLAPTLFKEFSNFDKHPSYKEGVLFTCMLQKSKVLDAFLAYAKYTPKHITFVDDQFENIQDIEQYCAQKGYSYHGIFYKGIETRYTDPVIDDVAHTQFQTLIRTGVWLNDEQAREQLKHISDNQLQQSA